jgi:hypothetical protein
MGIDRVFPDHFYCGMPRMERRDLARAQRPTGSLATSTANASCLKGVRLRVTNDLQLNARIHTVSTECEHLSQLLRAEREACERLERLTSPSSPIRDEATLRAAIVYVLKPMGQSTTTCKATPTYGGLNPHRRFEISHGCPL